MATILLFGGAFNPIHIEHIRMVERAIDSLHPQKVIIMPTYISPHKKGALMVENEHRLAMCKLAFAHLPMVEVSHYEMSKQEVSYSYITCEYLHALYPNDKLIFLMGADMLDYFPNWKYPERILAVCDIAAIARADEQEFAHIRQRFYDDFHRDIQFVPYVGQDVSSTQVRILSALGENVSHLVAPSVNDYILQHGLYLQPQLASVKTWLKEERWQHTIRVCKSAVKNRSQAGVDELTALTASALHDVAKYLPITDERLKNCPIPQNVPNPVVHQYTGAYIAQTVFGIQNEDILNAIRFHTSGRPEMSKLEQLIFLADMVEDGRDFPGVEPLRKLFYTNLTACLQASLIHQVEYLLRDGKPVYPLTLQAYQYYKG